jgi:hypothetical protein
MKIIFIVWAFPKTRAKQLANEFDAKLYGIEIINNYPKIIKYFISFIKTIYILLREKPHIIIAQVPPIFIAFPIYFYIRMFGGNYIFDMHSGEIADGKWKYFEPLRRFFFARAFLVLFHNKSNYRSIENKHWKINSTILNCLIPTPPKGISAIRIFNRCRNVVIISSFDDNEPYKECFEAFNELIKQNNKWHFIFTGDNSKIDISKYSKNITFTGFIDYNKYWGILKGADVIVSLHKRNAVITMGLWEGISLNKPVVTNNYEVIKELFNDNLIYTDNTSLHIANAIQKAYIERNSISNRIKVEKEIMKIKWDRKFSIIKNSFNK